MGCDIHAYIDYDDFETSDGDKRISCFASDVEIGRNYTLFTLMAGVRYDPRTEKDYGPMFEPRGIPDDISWRVRSAYHLHVTEYKEWQDDEGYCSPERAHQWVSQNISEWSNDEHTLITHPDWHSASYLYVDELEQIKVKYESIKFPESSWFQPNPPAKQPIPENATAEELEARLFGGREWYIQVGELKTYPIPVEIDAIIAAMKALNGDNPKRSRLVFWFDN